MHVEFDYGIMHHCRSRVTNRMPLEPLQASPEIQVVTLNPARTFFAGPVSPSRQELGVRLPLICVVTRDPAALQFLQELAASGVRAPFIDEGYDLASLPVVAVPGPSLFPLGADERPELIHFQVAHAPRVRGLVQSRGRLPQGFENRVGAQEQDALDVSDACAVDRQRDDQVSYCPDASQIGVVADKLAAAIFAQETLFSLSGFAIFNDAY
jgi:hypothetical protein